MSPDLARVACPLMDSYWQIGARAPVGCARVASYSRVGRERLVGVHVETVNSWNYNWWVSRIHFWVKDGRKKGSSTGQLSPSGHVVIIHMPRQATRCAWVLFWMVLAGPRPPPLFTTFLPPLPAAPLFGHRVHHADRVTLPLSVGGRMAIQRRRTSCGGYSDGGNVEGQPQ